jgi:hypothetical protein
LETIADEQDHLREAIAALLVNAGTVRSPAIAQEIVRLEQEIVRLQAEERQLADHVALIIPARLQARLDGLEAAAKTEPVDRAASDGPIGCPLHLQHPQRSLSCGHLIGAPNAGSLAAC